MYNITSTIFHKYQLSWLMENNKKDQSKYGKWLLN